MTKTAFVLAALTGLMLAAPSARAEETAATPGTEKPLAWRREHHEKIREEIRLHEHRARELEPIIARDREARRAVEINWVLLERHAREMHAKANEFRAIATDSGPGFAEDLNKWAAELDNFATRDEENGRIQHEIAERLDRVTASEEQAKSWHLEVAHRMEEWVGRHRFER